MPTVDEIRDSLDARIAEVHREIASLKAARIALQKQNGARPQASAPETPAPPAAAAQPTPTPRPRRARRAAPRRRRPVEVLLAGKLEAMLGDAPDGLSAATITERANARGPQVTELLRELESAGQVRRIGAGRGTRWRLVTDEERIAARVAELERLSSGRR